MISDGIERYELPVWSDLYEEKSHLLKENQVLYAVLLAEKKEDEVRLSCKWLDDLSRADEAMIEACDQAFDKAKYQTNKFNQKGNAPAKGNNAPVKNGQPMKSETPEIKAKAPAKAEPPAAVAIKMDANRVKLSHIVALKELFEKHRGTVPVKIEFYSESRALATLHIDSKWGVVGEGSFTKSCRRSHQSKLRAEKATFACRMLFFIICGNKIGFDPMRPAPQNGVRSFLHAVPRAEALG